VTTTTQILAIPQTAFPAGPQSFSGNIPADANSFSLLIQQVSWPHAGDDAFSMALSVSYDGGATWVTLQSYTFPDAPQPASKGIPADCFKVGQSIYPEQGQARKYKVDLNFLKPLTASGAVYKVV
jgi:hypothetical protein